MPKQCPREPRERAVHLVAEHRGDYESEYAAIRSIAARLGIATPETLRQWVRQAEVDSGQWPGVSSEESAEIRRLRAEVKELRRARHRSRCRFHQRHTALSAGLTPRGCPARSGGNVSSARPRLVSPQVGAGLAGAGAGRNQAIADAAALAAVQGAAAWPRAATACGSVSAPLRCPPRAPRCPVPRLRRQRPRKSTGPSWSVGPARTRPSAPRLPARGSATCPEPATAHRRVLWSCHHRHPRSRKYG